MQINAKIIKSMKTAEIQRAFAARLFGHTYVANKETSGKNFIIRISTFLEEHRHVSVSRESLLNNFAARLFGHT